MIRRFSIKNYKSIVDLSLDLGRINLFIGENGCGKTNILEAMAVAAAAVSDRLDTEELYLRGVRVAKPEITLSSFLGVKQQSEIELEYLMKDGDIGVHRPMRLSLQPVPQTGSAAWRMGYSEVGPTVQDQQALKRLSSVLKKLRGRRAEEVDGIDVAAALELLSKSMGSEGAAILLSHGAAQMEFRKRAGDFLIYNANHLALRGLMTISRKEPLGIHGENLDVTIASLGDEGLRELLRRSAPIRWVERIFTDPEDKLKFEGYKLGRSTSTLYFRDRFMRRRANVFSAENANEGILHALFYLALFISDRTPRTFGIDNIETALNPRLCRSLIKQLAELSKSHDKQALITTHNPAVLDGLDLHDDDQRLFVVARDDAGHTVATRIKLKPQPKDREPRRMLSEMWMRGDLGGIPLEF